MAPALGACTQDFDVFEPDASSSDAAVDVNHDGSIDSGGDSSDAATVTDGGLVFGCGMGTVSDCSQCNGMPEPCVYCSQMNPAMLAGECKPEGMSCFQGAPNGFGFCQCANSPATCPESYQVCRMGTCRTCAESFMNGGQACKGGGQCNPADGGCS